MEGATTMSNELQVKPKDEVYYKVSGQEIKLSPSIVQQFITKGNGQISKEEAVNFIQLCRYAELNPFLNEAYLIKFGSQPAQMVTSKEALLKRASRQPDYEGMTSGIIVMVGDDVRQKQGQMLYPGEKLLGGWAEIYRSLFKKPVYVEVAFEEYNTGKSTWAKMPANMINKVAEAAALRRAYPEQLGALYVEEEPSGHDLQQAVVVKEKNETTNQLLNDFKQPEVIEAEEVTADAEQAELELG